VSPTPAFLLDTNVLSETRKKKADSGVIAFLKAVDPSSLYLSVLTIGELRKGVAIKMRKDPIAAKSLAAWLQGLEVGFADRMVGIDAATARLWGDLSSDRSRAVVDTLLAATAILHGMTFVTRNTRDVRGIRIALHNPWTD
jgi:predicted nucleic acid-binding protein